MKYSIIRVVGKGSYGKVYLVKNKEGNEYAMKKIEGINRLRPKERKYLINEIVITILNRSKYLLRTIDITIDFDSISLISEYACFQDLHYQIKRYKQRNKKISLYYVNKWVYQVCLALKYLHSMNIIHRDVKSENIFLYMDKNVRLGDMGVIIQGKSRQQTCIGTPYYMSPEVHSHMPYTEKMDIWGLGVVFYELLYYSMPFEGRTMQELVRNIKTRQFKSDSKYLEQNFLLSQMLSKKESTRLSSRELVEHKYFKNIEDKENTPRHLALQPYQNKDIRRLINELRELPKVVKEKDVIKNLSKGKVLPVKEHIKLPPIEKLPKNPSKGVNEREQLSKALDILKERSREKNKNAQYSGNNRRLLVYEYNKIFKSNICF